MKFWGHDLICKVTTGHWDWQGDIPIFVEIVGSYFQWYIFNDISVGQVLFVPKHYHNCDSENKSIALNKYIRHKHFYNLIELTKERCGLKKCTYSKLRVAKILMLFLDCVLDMFFLYLSISIIVTVYIILLQWSGNNNNNN